MPFRGMIGVGPHPCHIKKWPGGFSGGGAVGGGGRFMASI